MILNTFNTGTFSSVIVSRFCEKKKKIKTESKLKHLPREINQFLPSRKWECTTAALLRTVLAQRIHFSWL